MNPAIGKFVGIVWCPHMLVIFFTRPGLFDFEGNQSLNPIHNLSCFFLKSERWTLTKYKGRMVPNVLKRFLRRRALPKSVFVVNVMDLRLPINWECFNNNMEVINVSLLIIICNAKAKAMIMSPNISKYIFFVTIQYNLYWRSFQCSNEIP